MYNCVCKGLVPNPTSKTLTVLDISYFADACSRTVRVQTYTTFKANTQNPVGHDSAV